MNNLNGMGALALTLATGSAFAFPTWTEVGDAGQLPGTAQVTFSAAGPLSSISGALGAASDVDMYLIWIRSPATFSASTVGGSAVDTQLFLFSTTGLGIAFNDDAGPSQSTLPAGNPLYSGLAPGIYLLAISGFNNDPSSAGGAIFPDSFPGVFGPTGPGGGSPVTSWTASGAAGAYSISLTGVGTPPSPSGMALLALAAMAGRRRRGT